MMENKNLLPTAPQRRGHSMPHRAGPHGEAPALTRKQKHSKGKAQSTVLVGASLRKARQGRGNSLEPTSWSNSTRSWGTEAVPSCLVPGPREI